MIKHAMNKQKGMTTIGVIIMVAIIGFTVLVSINVAPYYFTDSIISSLWKSLETVQSLIGLPSKKLRKVVRKRLKVNNVYDIKKEDIVIKKVKGFYIVTLEYEPRGKIVGSLDYIMTFKHEARVRFK